MKNLWTLGISLMLVGCNPQAEISKNQAELHKKIDEFISRNVQADLWLSMARTDLAMSEGFLKEGKLDESKNELATAKMDYDMAVISNGDPVK